MKCPDVDCRTSGFTLVVQDCHQHGAYTATVYRHCLEVDVDEQPVLAKAQSGTLFGAESFFDDAIRLLAHQLNLLLVLG